MGVMDGYWRWTLAAGEPIGLLYRIVDADGRVRPMLGERFALTIFDANRVARESVESTIEEDVEGDYVRTLLPLGTSDRLLGAGMLAWEFSRMLRGGERRPLFKGPLAITTSASATAAGSADFSEPDLFMIIDREEP